MALPDDVVVGEQHSELSVEVGPVRRARLDQAFPQRDRLGVAALKLDDASAGPFGEVGVVGELLGRLLVQRVELVQAEVGPLECAELDEVLDVDPERPAPVADVVLADDVVAEKVEESHRARRR